MNVVQTFSRERTSRASRYAQTLKLIEGYTHKLAAAREGMQWIKAGEYASDLARLYHWMALNQNPDL